MSEAHIIARVVRCGERIEVYRYSSGILCGREREYDIVKSKYEGETQSEGKRTDNLLRARQMLRRLIWCNQGKYTKFITLTYADTVLDVKKVRRDITTFVQAMRRKGYDMKYVYVLEHQKNRGKREGNEGCLHVHMVLFIDAFIPKTDLEKCWRHGWVDINAIDDIRNLGAYVCKYITKESETELEKNVYACSKGLKRPQEECFYAEGYSDSTVDLHPNELLKHIQVTYSKQMRYDFFRKDDLMCPHADSLIVTYLQGVWKDGDFIRECQEQNEG